MMTGGACEQEKECGSADAHQKNDGRDFEQPNLAYPRLIFRVLCVCVKEGGWKGVEDLSYYSSFLITRCWSE